MFNSLTANWSQWHWVWFAWGQLILAYIGYILYLNWRYRRLVSQIEEDER